MRAIDRRQFVIWAGALLAPFESSLAQSQPALRRIAILTPGTPATQATYFRAFKAGLQERGHVEGRDVEIEIYYAEGREEALAPLAAKIAARRPAVVVAGGTVAVEAARKGVPGVPIVTLVGDIVGTGLTALLSRPGSGVTGVSFQAASLDPKRLELLATLLPKGSAVLNLTDSSARAGSHTALGDAGRALGIVLHAVEARSPEEIDVAFDAARKLGVKGINVLTSPFLNTHRARIIKLAAAARLPAIYQWPETAEEGGLLGYGPRVTEIYRQLAGYASRILKGASPAELPVEQPKKYELVINRRTARAIGIAIPQAFLTRADHVID
jgi:putative ABC transport system substrate-binding protein